MRYRNHLIEPSYIVGSDIRTLKNGDIIFGRNPSNGQIQLRKPTRKDVEYYEIFDCMDTPDRFGDRVRVGAEFSIKSAKESVDRIHHLIEQQQRDSI